MKNFFTFSLLALLLFSLPLPTIAQDAITVTMPVTSPADGPELWVECGGLPGCRTGNVPFLDYLSTFLIPIVFNKLFTYIPLLGVLFIMIGGGYILLSAGNEERVTKGKTTITWAVIGIFIANFARELVILVKDEATSVPSGDVIISVITTLMGSIFDIMYVAMIGIALFSGMRMVLSLGKEDEFKKGQDGLFYAALGAIIINIAELIYTAFANL